LRQLREGEAVNCRDSDLFLQCSATRTSDKHLAKVIGDVREQLRTCRPDTAKQLALSV
jgi:hypothetical protein